MSQARVVEEEEDDDEDDVDADDDVEMVDAAEDDEYWFSRCPLALPPTPAPPLLPTCPLLPLLLVLPPPLFFLMTAGMQANSEESRSDRVTRLRGQWSTTWKLSSLRGKNEIVVHNQQQQCHTYRCSTK